MIPSYLILPLPKKLTASPPPGTRRLSRRRHPPALNLAWIQYPAWFGLPHGDGLTETQATLPSRLAFLSVAVWWAVFSIPLFLKIREPAVATVVGEPRQSLRRTLCRLGRHLSHSEITGTPD